MSRHVLYNRVTTPLLVLQAIVGELGTNTIGLGFGLIAFVDSNYYAHFGGFGVINGLNGLRLDTVIGGNHKYHDVSDFGTP